MRTASGIVLSAMLLICSACGGSSRGKQHPAPAAHPQRPAPAAAAGALQQPRPCRVCVKSPERVRLQRGQTTTVTWEITGTTLPVRAWLHNRNSAAVDVRGGDDQSVTSSGGTPNVVTAEVTAKSLGVFQVDVSVDEQEWLATVYRNELRRIAAKIQASMKSLGRGRQIRADDISAILDDTLADVDESLPFEELTAFRDAVREYVGQLRAELYATTSASRSGLETIRLVSQRPATGSIPAPAARSLLSKLRDFFIDASEVEPLTEICVVTSPVNGATLLLYPSSAPDTTERRTATRFPIYVGLYSWEIRKMTGYLDARGTINFLTDPDRVVECTLRRTESDANTCEPIMGNLSQRCRQ